mmetsp:Transcript_33219/g.53880  ORF Transcript_33219/g.53880 Transcript_33219/m.53880 type:complete len:579 (+) Transcript_33219:161-1897(+)|eukprot:CAMPEP_0184651728 /NCGR_PEP_ID=MMETSP0308-20130426/9382_1 /TAXON_ID=38269 /ORGANISM="Gloeochaete witrockiana, Strain SAG 46.84" /LENGTH=578 /DNA_ID=CAMNT_0027086155 /DNA_START=143 /DNA_END=1879 /DNA_ORIENTATION=-
MTDVQKIQSIPIGQDDTKKQQVVIVEQSEPPLPGTPTSLDNPRKALETKIISIADVLKSDQHKVFRPENSIHDYPVVARTLSAGDYTVVGDPLHRFSWKLWFEHYQVTPTSAWRYTVWLVHAFFAVGVLVAADQLLNAILVAAKVKFPSNVAALLVLIAILLLLSYIPAPSFLLPPTPPDDSANLKIERQRVMMDTLLTKALAPGLAWLGKWFPFFYTTPIIMIPLSPIPTGTTLVKLIFNNILGWAAAYFGSLAAVLFLTRALHLSKPHESWAKIPQKDKWHSHENTIDPIYIMWWFLAALLSGIIVHNITNFTRFLVFYHLSVVLFCYLLMTFLWQSANRPPWFKNIVQLFHPLLLSATLTSVIVQRTYPGHLNKWYTDALKSYQVKSFDYPGPGAGDLVLGLLGAAIISLAFKLHEARALVVKHLFDMGATIGIGAPGGLIFSAAIAKLFVIPFPFCYAIILRVMTVAVAIPMAKYLDESLPAATPAVLIAFNGILGAALNVRIYNWLKLDNQVALGVASGMASQGLGTAVLVAPYPTAAGIAGVTFSLIAIIDCILLSVPPFSVFVKTLSFTPA